MHPPRILYKASNVTRLFLGELGVTVVRAYAAIPDRKGAMLALGPRDDVLEVAAEAMPAFPGTA
jgi:hypothetical protein